MSDNWYSILDVNAKKGESFMNGTIVAISSKKFTKIKSWTCPKTRRLMSPGTYTSVLVK